MKYLAILLSVLFVALAAKPCVDSETISSGRYAELSQTNDGHEHSSDLCSPFCSCACCGIQILNHQPQEFTVLEILVQPVSKPLSLYKKSFVSDYFGSIWQPPQLS